MHDMMQMGWLMMLFGAILLVALIALVVILIVRLMRRGRDPR
jgi:hypothetical protein